MSPCKMPVFSPQCPGGCFAAGCIVTEPQPFAAKTTAECVISDRYSIPAAMFIKVVMAIALVRLLINPPMSGTTK